MDVELQILKHLARDPQQTTPIIDKYCRDYQDLFPEVRSYEHFKYLHLGIVCNIKRKSLPEIAKAVGIDTGQSLHHFLAKSPWSVPEVRQRRLAKIRAALQGQNITLVIDETGDRKKGKKTDYVARQYLGSVGKLDRGIVTVNAYGIYNHITFALLFKVFKPQGTLQITDTYKTKIELASELVDELMSFGFNINLVLADSLYGESSNFIKTLNRYNLPWVLSIRSNHGVLIPSYQKVRANQWAEFERKFSNQSSEKRYIREIIFGKRRSRTYWEITTDPVTLPANSTSFLMTNLTGSQKYLKQQIGNLYGLRTWVEYGFRQCKQELGWTDYRLTKFEQIEKWWEIVFSVYLMVSINSQPFIELYQSSEKREPEKPILEEAFPKFWNEGKTWKNSLNNIRLLMQPLIALWLIYPWLEVFPQRNLLIGLHKLVRTVAHFQHHFSSA